MLRHVGLCLKTDMSDPIKINDRGNLTEEKIAAGRWAWVVVPSGDGYTIGMAVEGISGFFPSDYDPVNTYDKADKWASVLNERRLGPMDEIEIIASSMGKNPTR